MAATRYRPAYLAHIKVRRLGAGPSWEVLLEPSGRSLVPAHMQHGLAEIEPKAPVRLGLVAPRMTEWVEGRQRVKSWGYNRWGHPDDGGSGAHRTRREAAESCAVEAIEGASARQRFNVARSQRRRSA